MVKFLIVRFSSIGDIVLTTPVVRCLKQQVEGAEVHFLTKKSFASIVSKNPHIDKVHVLEDSLGKVIKELQKEDFNYVIDLHHNLRSSIVKARLKAISFSFNKLNLEKWLMVNWKVNRLPDVHIVDRYMHTLRHFDVQNDNQGLDFFIDPADEVSLNSLPESHRNGYVGFVIGAKHNTKKLPTAKIISLINKIALPVVLLGGKEDATEADQISKSTGNLCYNACGKYNLGQSASLVKQANVIVSHDTGLMHIASAFKKKIISVWGNTIPGFGMYPYLPHPESMIAEVNGLKCRPCSKIGYPACPQKHFNCMKQIDEDAVVKRVREMF